MGRSQRRIKEILWTSSLRRRTARTAGQSSPARIGRAPTGGARATASPTPTQGRLRSTPVGPSATPGACASRWLREGGSSSTTAWSGRRCRRPEISRAAGYRGCTHTCATWGPTRSRHSRASSAARASTATSPWLLVVASLRRTPCYSARRSCDLSPAATRAAMHTETSLPPTCSCPVAGRRHTPTVRCFDWSTLESASGCPLLRCL
mmetsp:Transcript_621/g.1720  ORF Transcript_621/g.1720 Transcript_621/m.1720 type:complete len:207 (+) Transcript_621:333-953(+)